MAEDVGAAVPVEVAEAQARERHARGVDRDPRAPGVRGVLPFGVQRAEGVLGAVAVEVAEGHLVHGRGVEAPQRPEPGLAVVRPAFATDAEDLARAGVRGQKPSSSSQRTVPGLFGQIRTEDSEKLWEQ